MRGATPRGSARHAVCGTDARSGGEEDWASNARHGAVRRLLAYMGAGLDLTAWSQARASTKSLGIKRRACNVWREGS